MVTFTGDVPPLISHSAHPKHVLELVATGGEQFQCDGCKQLGQERRYRCGHCDFDLHICCARAPAGIDHPMFEARALTFFHSRALSIGSKPYGTVWCDVCGNQVLGFLFHNRHGLETIDVHPPCAILPERIVEDDGRVLELHKAAGHRCGLCGQDGHRGRFLAYRLQDDDGELVYLHVACLMEANYCTDAQVVLANSVSVTTGEVGHGRLVNAPTTGEPATLQSVPAPTIGELATLQNAPVRKTGSFRRFCKVAFLVARVSFAVTTMDPVGLVTAIASPI